MSELKIKTHTTYTYETTDGREFDDADEAQEWQDALDNIKDITMLDNRFKPTTDYTKAFYVHIKTEAQLKAFRAINSYEGMYVAIDAIGYWYYDRADNYVSVREEMDRLQSIIEALDVLGK